jgi:hypothetical protein
MSLSANIILPSLYFRNPMTLFGVEESRYLVVAVCSWPVPGLLLRGQSSIIFYEYINLFAIKFRLSNKIW